jgi:hypothetical protein
MPPQWALIEDRALEYAHERCNSNLRFAFFVKSMDCPNVKIPFQFSQSFGENDEISSCFLTNLINMQMRGDMKMRCLWFIYGPCITVNHKYWFAWGDVSQFEKPAKISP